MRRLRYVVKLCLGGFSRVELEILASLWISTFVCMADANIIGILVPDMCREFGLTVGYVGSWTKAAHALGAVVGSLLCGPLSDRWGRYHFLLWGSVVFTLCSFLTWVSADFTSLVVFRTLVGLATGTLTINTVAYVSDVFAYQRRGVAMGVIFSGTFTGLIFGVPAAAYLAAWMNSWRAIFVVFGVLSLIATVSVAKLLSHRHYQRERATRQGRAFLWASLKEYGAMLAYPPALAAISTVALSTAGMFGAITYIPAYLEAEHGIPTTQTSQIFLVMGPTALIFSIWAGRIADATSKRAVVLASSVVLFAILLVFPEISYRMLWIYLGSAVCFGAGAARMGPINAILSELVPAGKRSSLFALRNMASYLGVTLGAVGGGLLYDGRYGFPGICYGGAAILFVSLGVVYFGLPEPGKAESGDLLPAMASESEVVS